ncbi:hypothetical protein [Bradyrhizobium sp. Ai1a-2]|uniref:hypothetical protein n=1 Tax=Bradyrhizobium sp. Ai1a-2 TaxID=196490 RepID=UPI00041B10EB|nr:hypothetical protein [Bradyrhizobium sp. Ai1a-2]
MRFAGCLGRQAIQRGAEARGAGLPRLDLSLSFDDVDTDRGIEREQSAAALGDPHEQLPSRRIAGKRLREISSVQQVESFEFEPRGAHPKTRIDVRQHPVNDALNFSGADGKLFSDGTNARAGQTQLYDLIVALLVDEFYDFVH